MASKANKTTFAKLDRERRLREKREDKKARRIARKEQQALEADQPASTLDLTDEHSTLDLTDEHSPLDLTDEPADDLSASA